jgi:hypothetical protein
VNKASQTSYYRLFDWHKTETLLLLASLPILTDTLLNAQQVVLVPTLFGACARAYMPGVAKAVDSNRRAVVYFSAACLACVPWMQVGGGLKRRRQFGRFSSERSLYIDVLPRARHCAWNVQQGVRLQYDRQLPCH